MNIAKRLGALAIVGLFILSCAVSTVIASGQVVETGTQIGSQEAVKNLGFAYSRAEYRVFPLSAINTRVVGVPSRASTNVRLWNPQAMRKPGDAIFLGKSVMNGTNAYLPRTLNESAIDQYNNVPSYNDIFPPDVFPPDNTTTETIPEGATNPNGWAWGSGSYMMDGMNAYLRSLGTRSLNNWGVFA